MPSKNIQKKTFNPVHDRPNGLKSSYTDYVENFTTEKKEPPHRVSNAKEIPIHEVILMTLTG